MIEVGWVTATLKTFLLRLTWPPLKQSGPQLSIRKRYLSASPALLHLFNNLFDRHRLGCVHCPPTSPTHLPPAAASLPRTAWLLSTPPQVRWQLPLHPAQGPAAAPAAPSRRRSAGAAVLGSGAWCSLTHSHGAHPAP